MTRLKTSVCVLLIVYNVSTVALSILMFELQPKAAAVLLLSHMVFKVLEPVSTAIVVLQSC